MMQFSPQDSARAFFVIGIRNIVLHSSVPPTGIWPGKQKALRVKLTGFSPPVRARDSETSLLQSESASRVQ